jgi:hypothetical protein
MSAPHERPPTLSEAARILASQRHRQLGTCEECGKPFEATSRRRYCSGTCNMRAWRRHQRTEQPAAA